MGHREIRRVALDFDWPLNKTWEGYINPYMGMLPCLDCDQSGLNPETKQLSDDWYDIDGDGLLLKRYEPVSEELYNKAVQELKSAGRDMNYAYLRHGWRHNVTQEEVNACADANRLQDWTHTWSRETGWVRRADNFVPTAVEVNYASIISHFGGADSYICLKIRATKLGFYGNCVICNGEGETKNENEEIFKKWEAWKQYEPPKGPGYQIWETTSEGSPVSPVFATPEELAKYAEQNCSIFGSRKISYNSWLEMILKDTMSVGSLMVSDNKGIRPACEISDEAE